MNSKPSTRIKTEAATFVPESLEDVNAAVAAIGQCQRRRDRIQTEMNDRLAALRARYEEQAAPHAERISELSMGVQTYCETHRAELTREGKVKTAKLAAGEVSWRMRPPSVSVRGMQTVVDALRKLKLDRFLRVKTEVNKDAILDEPDAVSSIKGISVSQREDFVIKPFETELEEVR